MRPRLQFMSKVKVLCMNIVRRYKQLRMFEKVKQEDRRIALERSRIMKQKQTELLAKIQAATVHIPKPPPSKTLKVR